jgi:DNA polymerase epsilon subunit 1
VFECFLKGETLAECYEAVAEIANYWLDVLDSKGQELDEEELMELISENKTISKTLTDYGDQKGTSLTTASRLADFLGPDMVKDRGLNCRLVIANRPYGAPVTDRALPTAIFSAEPGVRKHFLRKWLKDSAMTDFSIRAVIDWDYYKERLGKTIQKIITIPAAMQRVPNPVPRVGHPDWLEKKVRELTDGRRQLKISALFAPRAPSPPVLDIEDTASGRKPGGAAKPATAIVRRVVRGPGQEGEEEEEEEVEGQGGEADGQGPKRPQEEQEQPAAPAKCPPVTEDFFGWLKFRKVQWRAARLERQREGREAAKVGSRRGRPGDSGAGGAGGAAAKRHMDVESFLKSAAMAVTQGVWQIIEVRETEIAGDFVVWAMTGQRSLQRLSVSIDRTFYVTSNVDQEAVFLSLGGRKVSRSLPHGHRSPFTYELVTPERRFVRNENGVANLLCTPGVTGVYELQTPLWLRMVVQLGCVAKVGSSRQRPQGMRTFRLQDLDSLGTSAHPYLHPSSASFRMIYVYQSQSLRQGLVAMFVIQGDNADLEPDRTPGMGPARLLSASCKVWLANPYSGAEARPPLKRIFSRYAPPDVTCDFSCSYVTSVSGALEQLNRSLATYTQERNGPTVVIAQSAMGLSILRRHAAVLNDMPVVMMPTNADDNRYPALGWQAYAAQRMAQRFLLMQEWLQERLLIARYAHIPLGNIGLDAQRSMADVSFARLLLHNRHVLWASEGTKPDLGGAEGDENDAWADEAESPVIRVPGAYRKICIELELVGLAVNSVRMSQELDQMDGAQGLAARDVVTKGATRRAVPRGTTGPAPPPSGCSRPWWTAG